MIAQVLDCSKQLSTNQWQRKGLRNGGDKSEGQVVSPAGPREGGVLGEGEVAPPHQLGGLGSAVSSPSGVRGKAPANIFIVWKPHLV